MTSVISDSGPARPALTVNSLPSGVRAAVLLLHGGQSDSRHRPPPPWGLPAARMIPFGRSVLRSSAGRAVALATARYRFRGWNGDHADPVQDARWAVDALVERTGPVPVVLVGHSMGGRAALWAAGHPLVTGVVALAPWCPLEDPVDQLTGRRSVLLHCPVDRITDARGSWELVHRARAGSAPACGIAMPRGGHTMLRGAADWHRITTALVNGLLGLTPPAAARRGRPRPDQPGRLRPADLRAGSGSRLTALRDDGGYVVRSPCRSASQGRVQAFRGQPGPGPALPRGLRTPSALATHAVSPCSAPRQSLPRARRKRSRPSFKSTIGAG